MNDPTLFATGALFTQDYLSEGLTNSANYRSIDVVCLRSGLEATAHWSRYRSRDLALAWINALRAGQLNPQITG